MTGKVDVGSNGLTKLALNKDGIDFAAVSLQPIPAGEYVPLLFTARNLTAEATAAGDLRGMYDVPSYRGATFMDPKVSAALYMYAMQ
jgi:photosystem II oxygen-evolving enhancer protein 1